MIAQPPIPDPTTAAADAPPAPPDTTCPPHHAHPRTPSPPSPPSPPLSPSDRTLLYAYFELHENLAALAHHLASAPPLPGSEERGQGEGCLESSPSVPSCLRAFVPSPDYFSLLTWLNQPHIQEALEAHDRAVARNDRRRALDGIRQSLDTADNPTNLRRAATTLLRSTIVRTASTVNPDRKGGARNPSPPPENSSPALPIQNPQSKIQNQTTAPPPPPRSTPIPSADPAPALAAIRDALASPQAAVALSTLHAHAAFPPLASAPADSSPSVASSLRRSVAAPSPTFASYPIPADRAQFIATALKTLPAAFRFPLTLSGGSERERTDTRLTRTAWLRTTAGDSFFCSLTLTRDPPPDQEVNPDRQGGAQEGPTSAETPSSPDPPCWRLASLDILRRSA
jgi:hypothetical protein